MKKRFAMFMLAVGMTFCIGGCAIGHDAPLTDEQSTLFEDKNTDETVTEAPTESPEISEETSEFEPIEQILVTVGVDTGFTVYDDNGESVKIEDKKADCCCGTDGCCCGNGSCCCGDTEDTEDNTASVTESENGLFTVSVYEQTEDYTTYEITVNGWTGDSRISIGTENFTTDGILSVKCAYGEVGTSDFDFANVQITDGKIEWVELPDFVGVEKFDTTIENERPADN